LSNAQIRNPTGLRRSWVAGQALVEFVVGLLVLCMLILLLLQIGRTGVERTRLIKRARTNAAAYMIAESYVGMEIPFIQDWRVGRDGVSHSADDVARVGDPVPFQMAAGTTVHYRQITYPFPERIYRHESASLQFPDITGNSGFVRGDVLSVRIPVYPLLRKTLYNKDEIRLDHAVWMVWLKGLE